MECSLLHLLVKCQINICYSPVGGITFLGTVANGLLELRQEVEAVVVDNLWMRSLDAFLILISHKETLESLHFLVIKPDSTKTRRTSIIIISWLFLLATVDKVTFTATWQFPFTSDLCLNVNQSVKVSCSFKAAVYDAVPRKTFSTRNAPL